MANTPSYSTLNVLLQGLNSGLNIFASGQGPRIDSESSSDEAESNGSPRQFSNGGVSSVVGMTLNNIGNDDGGEKILSVEETTKPAASTDNATMGKSKRKKASTAKKNKKETKETTSTSNANDGATLTKDPSEDPPRKRLNNPLEMGAAFEQGYDSDGWLGPERGTNPKELEALDEDELKADDVVIEPCFMPISDDTLNGLTVSQIKHELLIRNVGLPRSKKKASLLSHLKDALAKKVPVYPPGQRTKPNGEDMADFEVGAKWIELIPDLNVDEPINEAFPNGRALNIPAAEAGVPPKPKQSFSRLFVYWSAERPAAVCFLEEACVIKRISASRVCRSFLSYV